MNATFDYDGPITDDMRDARHGDEEPGDDEPGDDEPGDDEEEAP